MKPFLLYTLARVALFAASFGLVWLVFGHWIEWGAISALYTAIIAMVISSVVALLVLGSLRDDFAVQVVAARGPGEGGLRGEASRRGRRRRPTGVEPDRRGPDGRSPPGRPLTRAWRST